MVFFVVFFCVYVWCLAGQQLVSWLTDFGGSWPLASLTVEMERMKKEAKGFDFENKTGGVRRLPISGLKIRTTSVYAWRAVGTADKVRFPKLPECHAINKKKSFRRTALLKRSNHVMSPA